MGDIVCFKDRSLVHSYLTGNEDAGRELYENTYEPLLYFIKSHCKQSALSMADIEEIASETMLRSVERLDTYNGTSTFCTFLCGIAKNVIKEFLRKRGREVSVDFEAHLEAEGGTGSDLTAYLSEYGILPEDYVIRKENITQVAEALKQLQSQQPDYYDIIQLRVLNGVPYAVISQLSGESVAALESRFRRALAALKKNLKFCDGFSRYVP